MNSSDPVPEPTSAAKQQGAAACAPLALPLPAALHRELTAIAQLCRDAGGRALVVGGGVRDALLGLEPKDCDMEVFGIAAVQLEALLGQRYTLNVVGRSFGVFKLRGLELDVSLPRRESKQGSGHRGFAVEGDPTMTLEEAAARRDFTINTLYWDPLTQEVLDPCGGRADLAAGVLRHVSAAFSEDPLRVLRAMQFVARFELCVAPQTLALCRSIEPEGLPVERLFEEWSKLILKGVRPSLGLAFLRDCGWVRYYPELEAMIGCAQDKKWHPEGDVWTHTLHCMDAFAAARLGEPWEDLVVGLAVLLHDIGKPVTTYTDADGRIRSPRHDSEGVALAEAFLRRISRHQALLEEVLPLVACHMHPTQFYTTQAGQSAIRRLALRVKRIDRLVRVAEADMAGRPPLPADFPAGQWLLQSARALAVADSAPAPILQGRDLIAQLGMQPGKQMGEALRAAYEAQLEGEVTDTDSGIAFVQAWLRRHK